MTKLFLLAFAPAAMLFAKEPLKTVPSVDLTKYQGKWFEIARLPNSFQRDCTGNVTATYNVQPNKQLGVLNECKEKGRTEPKKAEGWGRVVDPQTNSKLEVRFAPRALSWLPMVWGDYQIIALGDKYDYALVGTPDRKYLWVLSRTPRMDPALYQRLLDQAKSQGFDVSKMMKTEQVWGNE
jgi:apolipoprotein D and lipocalin family protein